MVGVLEILYRVHHYRLPVLGFCGLIMTLTRSTPGTSIRVIGPLRLDMFYISIVVCGALLLSVSIRSEYDPEDYR